MPKNLVKPGKKSHDPSQTDNLDSLLILIVSYFRRNFFKSKTLLISFLFFLILSLLFLELIFNTGLIFSSHDVRNSFWQVYSFLHDNFQKSGLIALWFPGHASGVSLLGNPELFPSYPLYWLNFILPPSYASSWIIFISILLGGIFSFLLAKKSLKVDNSIATFFAVSVLLTPKIYAHVFAGHISLITAFPYISIISLTYYLLLDKPNIKRSVLLSLSVFLMYLTGGVQTLFYTLVLLSFFTFFMVVYYFFKSGFKFIYQKIYQVAPFLLLAILLAIGLSFFQLFSAIKHVGISQRANLSYWDVAILSLFSADFTNFFRLIPEFKNPEVLVNIGFLPMLLLPFGLFSKSVYKWPLLVLTLFTILFAFGANDVFKLHRFFFEFVPGFQYFRVPPRILFQFSILALLLSSLGLNWISQRKFIGQGRRIFITTITVLTIFQLFLVDKSLIKPAPSPDIDPDITITAAYLKELFQNEDPPPRLYSTFHDIPESAVYLAGGQAVDGAENLFVNDYVKYMEIAGNYNFRGYSNSIPPSQIFFKQSQFYETPTPNPTLLGLLNTKFIFSTYPINDPSLILQSEANQIQGNWGPLYVYENKQVLPRAFLTYSSRFSQDSNDLKKFDPTKEVLVPKGYPEIKSDQQYTVVNISGYTPTKINLDAVTEKNAYLFLGEIYYPDWNVYINGKREEIIKANHLFRAVYLTPGNYRIEFRYEPVTLAKPEVLISLTSLLLSILILLPINWKKGLKKPQG